MKEDNDEFDPELNEISINKRNPEEFISIIMYYMEILKTENKQVINFAGRQGQLLKQFKETEQFLEIVDLSQFTIYLILYKFLSNTKS